MISADQNDDIAGMRDALKHACQRRHIIVAFLIIGITMAVGRWMRVGAISYERIGPYSHCVIREGTIFFNGQGSVIAKSALGGVSRVVAAAGIAQIGPLNVDEIAVSDNSIIFGSLEPVAKSLNMPDHATSTKTAIYALDYKSAILRPITTVPSDRIALSGGIAYWLAVRRSQHAHVSVAAADAHNEKTTSSDLWVTSLRTGKSRLVGRGLPIVKLMPFNDGVIWKEFRGKRRMLGYCSNQDLVPRTIGDYSGGYYAAAVVRVRDRLFWFGCLGESLPGARRPSELDSVDIFGQKRTESTGSRQAGDASVWNGMEPFGPYLHRGALYCVTSILPPDGDGKHKRQLRLCKISPENARLFEVIAELPEDATFVALDGDYAYFAMHEARRHESVRGWLTGDVTDIREKTTLCRMRLPSR